MKVCLLGATGRTGKHILQQLLDHEHSVTVVVRNVHKLSVTSGKLTVIEGTPLDKLALAKAVQDCDAVISALNISRNSDFPWSALRTPKHFLSTVMQMLIELCEQYGVQRMIVISAWGVADSWKEIPGWFRWMVDKSNIGYAYKDHAVQEELLKQSLLQWSILRPVVLTNSKKAKAVRVSFQNQPRPGLFISRGNLAAFIVQILEQHQYICQTPVVYT